MGDENFTTGDFLRNMADRMYPADHPERIFAFWMIDNMADLRGAAEKLGVTVEEGPQFGARLKAAVLPILLEQRKEGKE